VVFAIVAPVVAFFIFAWNTFAANVKSLVRDKVTTSTKRAPESPETHLTVPSVTSEASVCRVLTLCLPLRLSSNITSCTSAGTPVTSLTVTSNLNFRGSLL